MAAWPLAARAQQAAVPLIGFLHNGGPEASQYYLPAFHKGLSEAGFVEGRNVAIEYRWARNENGRLPELAADLVRRRVAVIATPGSSLAAVAAKAETATIPIVFAGSDPVQLGLVPSLARPGGNVTGFATMTDELGAKQLGLLHELVPRAERFAVFFNPESTSSPTMIARIREAASTLGRTIEFVPASNAQGIVAGFASLVEKRIDALLVHANPFFGSRRVQLALFAARHAIPAIYAERRYAEAGGLMSYGPDIADQFRQVGIYTGRILKGEKPADLPVQQPTKFELLINQQTAVAMGFDIPPSLLAIADGVIE